MYKDTTILPTDGHDYKANLHSHTTNSDGHLTPDQAVALYRAHGYHILCLSEHDRYTDYRAQFNSDDFLILPGLEASANLYSDDGRTRLATHHLHGILGTTAMQAAAPHHFTHLQHLPVPTWHGQWDGLAAAQQVADTLRDHGCLVTYNHPLWSRIRLDDIATLRGIWAIEIYNYNTVNEAANGHDTTYWDHLLATGQHIHAFASDDNHNEGHFPDSCGGWITIRAPRLDHDTIITALIHGHYTSSTGPHIYNWGISHDTVWIDTTPASRIHLITTGPVNTGAALIAPPGQPLTHAEIPLTGSETTIRLEVIDENGHTAWTNAHHLERE